MKYKKNKLVTGFTLVELMVVVTIIGILAAVGMASFSQTGKKSRDATRKADLETVRQALMLYQADNGCFPASGTIDATAYDAMMIVIKDDYLAGDAIRDPKDSGDYKYAYGAMATANCAGGSSEFTLYANSEVTGDTNAFMISNL